MKSAPGTLRNSPGITRKKERIMPSSSDIPSNGEIRFGGISAWVLASRPRTLTAGTAPVILGAAAAAAHGGAFSPVVTALALACCLLLQVGTNLANDYFDAGSGVDNDNRLGPVRVTHSGLIAPHRVKRAFYFCFTAAAVLGIPLAVIGGWPIVAIGVLSILFAYLYTGGPYPLAYRGLGEVLAFVFYGLVATGGVYWLNTRAISAGALLAGAGTGCIAAFLMGINNLRDLYTDRKAGKITLPAFLGEPAARIFVAGLCLVSVLVPVLHVSMYPDQPWVLLASAGVLPFAARFSKILTAPVDAGFNGILAAAGKYLFVYAVLFSVGMLAGQG